MSTLLTYFKTRDEQKSRDCWSEINFNRCCFKNVIYVFLLSPSNDFASLGTTTSRRRRSKRRRRRCQKWKHFLFRCSVVVVDVASVKRAMNIKDGTSFVLKNSFFKKNIFCLSISARDLFVITQVGPNDELWSTTQKKDREMKKCVCDLVYARDSVIGCRSGCRERDSVLVRWIVLNKWTSTHVCGGWVAKRRVCLSVDVGSFY